MSNKIKTSELPEFDMAEQLRTEEDIVEYLSLVLEDGDSDEFYRAIGFAAKAKGMTQIAQSTGLGRESLHKSFRVGAKPQFDTVLKVLKAIGIDLKATAHSNDKHSHA